MIKLLATKACGSAIAEAFLTCAHIPYERTELDYSKPSPKQKFLLKNNPLGQVPTLILDDGRTLTETLAIAHFCQD